jgi:hypothetical protein
MSQNPYLFIVGCPRSGTTLLKRIVNAHPSIAIPRESHWIPRWYERRTGLTPEGFITPKLIPSLLEYRRFSRLGFTREDLEPLMKSGTPASYATFVTGIFDLYGQAQGKPLVGDKTPGYARRIRTLHSLWPKVRFVHLIRDGRDVCLSVTNWRRRIDGFNERFSTWKEDPSSTAALWWEWHVRLARETGSSLGPDLYYEMHYESLVTDPAAECQALCEFLAVPYDDAMLHFSEGRTKTEPGLDAKHAHMPITPGLRDWRTQLAAQDVERFEALVGDLLDELGYARAFPYPKTETRRYASSIHEIFTQEARSRRRLLPEEW